MRNYCYFLHIATYVVLYSRYQNLVVIYQADLLICEAGAVKLIVSS